MLELRDLATAQAAATRRANYARFVLGLALAAMATAALAIAIASERRSRNVIAQVQLSTDDAVESIRLVQVMGMDVLRQRILLDQHIYENAPERIGAVDREISVNRMAFMLAAIQYAPLARFPGEAEAWHRLLDDIAALNAPVDHVLELSRMNRDTEAHDALLALSPRFVAVATEVDELVAINELGAREALAHVRNLEAEQVAETFLLSLLSIAVTVAIGLYATGLVSREERMLRQYAAALEDRNRELDAFAGRVAHDLRGPLTTISLSVSRLAEDRPRDDRVFDVLDRGVARMESLIRDLLALSRASVRAHGAGARTEAVAATLERELGPMVREVGGVFHVELEPAEVACGEGLLCEVLWNLGENAVKYRSAEVPLALDIVGRAHRDRYVLRVSDNGSGMSPDELHHAFEPLFRGEKARAIPGTGLGLSIVHRVIDASGGTIRLESRLGVGTTFEIELPLTRGAAL